MHSMHSIACTLTLCLSWIMLGHVIEPCVILACHHHNAATAATAAASAHHLCEQILLAAHHDAIAHTSPARSERGPGLARLGRAPHPERAA